MHKTKNQHLYKDVGTDWLLNISCRG